MLHTQTYTHKEKNMFITPDKVIDSIQSGKKQFVNAIIKDDKFKSELNKLIDSQTEFAKGSVNSSLEIMQAFVKNAGTAFYKKG